MVVPIDGTQFDCAALFNLFHFPFLVIQLQFPVVVKPFIFFLLKTLFLRLISYIFQKKIIITGVRSCHNPKLEYFPNSVEFCDNSGRQSPCRWLQQRCGDQCPLAVQTDSPWPSYCSTSFSRHLRQTRINWLINY